jgi:threonylcarbamoyladenosine tRNA methylthiotransferase MtaB
MLQRARPPLNNSMKVTVLTLGCRVNQSESSILEGTLKENGATIVNLSEKPDYCIVNTCTVTSRSDYNSRQLLRRASKTGAKVIVTGCYSQLKPEVVKAIPGVTAVVDIKRKHEIIGLISGTQHGLVYGSHSRSRPYLKIQDGCNFRCSYCSVPLARGKSRSLPPEEVIRRAQIIESSGFHEVVLTGIHLGTYGHDLNEKIDLSVLLKKLLIGTRSLRIRLSSLEVKEMDGAMTELLQEGRICKHLHLPLQSGSGRILKLMKRNYTPADYRRRVLDVSSRIENISLGADVIAGFPGEGDAEFQETFDLLESLPLTYLHIFPFSPRPGTEAASLGDRPSKEMQTERLRRLKELHERLRRRYMTRQIGRELTIILEEEREGKAVGTSGNYLKVRCAFRGLRKGSIVDVRAEGVSGSMIEAAVIRAS